MAQLVFSSMTARFTGSSRPELRRVIARRLLDPPLSLTKRRHAVEPCHASRLPDHSRAGLDHDAG
jgi:hypothetical protein